MAIHLSKSNFNKLGVVATTPPLAQAPATKKKSILGLMNRLRPSIHCAGRVQGSSIVSFCPRALRCKLISGTLWQADDKQMVSWAHSLAALLRCWALSGFDDGENITGPVQFGRKESVFDEHCQTATSSQACPGTSKDR
jgi:hypothetical protein